MDPITLIIGALAAGAASGGLDALKDGAKTTVTAAYGTLRSLVRKRVAGNPGAELALTEYDADPATWTAPLTAKLQQVDAGGDADLVAAARALMELVDQAGARAGKYNVTITDAKGVQIGDNGIQVNHF